MEYTRDDLNRAVRISQSQQTRKEAYKVIVNNIANPDVRKLFQLLFDELNTCNGKHLEEMKSLLKRPTVNL